MARGQVLTLPNQSAQLIGTSSKEEMDSVAVLNPNDGVIYLKLNGAAGPSASQWDWKLPSQSFGLFPGPWISLGLYYLDQSGSGRSAEANIYDSTNKLYVPVIQAIGRAVQTAGTTMDITQGNQPSNPPAGTSRLWVDGSGNLHLLSPTGTDKAILDSTTMFGGDIFGISGSLRIGLQYNHTVGAYDNGGTLFNTYAPIWTDNSSVFWQPKNQPFRFCNSAGGELIDFDNSGNIVANGNIKATAGTLTLNDFQLFRSSAGNAVLWNVGGSACNFWCTGTLNLGPTGSPVGWYNNGGNMQTTSPINTTSSIQAASATISGALTSGAHTASAIMSSTDWLRTNTSGQGIYNNATGTGVGLTASGPTDYNSGELLLHSRAQVINILQPGDIAHQWDTFSAPAGSTTSAALVNMPAPFNALTLTGYAGGRLHVVGVFQLVNSGASAAMVGLSIDGNTQNMNSGTQFAGSSTWGVIPFAWSGTLSAGNRVLNFQWMVYGGFTLSINTAIYTRIWVVELIK